MQTSHYQSEHSCRSGLGPITFLQAKHARVLQINNTHTLVDTKASKRDHLRKATHPGTDIIVIPTKVNIHRDFAIFTVYSTEWHIVYSL